MSSEISAETLSESLIPAAVIVREVRQRLSPYQLRNVARSSVTTFEQDGWTVEKRLRMLVKMRKRKPHDIAFRDRVWSAFARLDFELMNRGDGIEITISAGGIKQQISVFAGNDEVLLLITCASSEKLRTSHLRPEIHSVKDSREAMMVSLRKQFPGRKIKFIIATNNLAVTPSAREAMADADIIHLDEESIDYYMLLADHLGKAARYQLLGSLFAGQRIPALDPEVHAIRGRMGGIPYYFFAIEPERLLKIAYILHRNKANIGLMPTYQRLIKKSRLQAVSRFVDDGGFFPNSIIINLDTGNRLRFDAASKASDGPVLGKLYLPQTYQAAYVIDGQHRLYGYANSERAISELIPVVAFVNLPRSEQVRLFMQINENQQAVPKNLRNTLNADLLWDSDDLREQVRALKLRIAQYLGEAKTSPLYGRIILGENLRSQIRCLTIDAINNGLTRGNFLGSFYKARVKDAGTFYLGTNDATFNSLTPFIERCISHVRDGLERQWALGSRDGGFVFINTGIESLLRLFSDIIDHLIAAEGIDPRIIPTDQLFVMAEPYLDLVVEHLHSLDGEQAVEYRRMYGSGGSTRYWRRLQIAIQEGRPSFSPPGLQAFIQDEAKAFNTESFEMIRELETFLNRDIQRRLKDKFGDAKWFHLGVPRRVKESAMRLMADKNVELDPDEHVTPWDCLHLIDYQTIMTQSQEIWLELFSKQYTRPGEESKPGGWAKRANWLVELNRIRNENDHTYIVKPEEYEFLAELTAWLVKGDLENSLNSTGP